VRCSWWLVASSANSYSARTRIIIIIIIIWVKGEVHPITCHSSKEGLETLDVGEGEVNATSRPHYRRE
jgi:hypothetical protein